MHPELLLAELHSFGKPGLSGKAEVLFAWHKGKENTRKVRPTISVTRSLQKSLWLPRACHSDQGSGHIKAGRCWQSGTPPQLPKRYSEPPRHGVLLWPVTLCLASFTYSAKCQRPPMTPSRS